MAETEHFCRCKGCNGCKENIRRPGTSCGWEVGKHKEEKTYYRCHWCWPHSEAFNKLHALVETETAPPPPPPGEGCAENAPPPPPPLFCPGSLQKQEELLQQQKEILEHQKELLQQQKELLQGQKRLLQGQEEFLQQQKELNRISRAMLYNQSDFRNNWGGSGTWSARDDQWDPESWWDDKWYGAVSWY